jgi:ferredoxin-like protein FixX
MPNGMFIDIKISNKVKKDGELSKQVIESCPVDIFAIENEEIEVNMEYVDECTLCNLCINVTNKEDIQIIKIYNEN